MFLIHVKAKDGHAMHFDVITDKKETEKAIEYTKEWLKTIDEVESRVTLEECHSESVPEEVEIEIMTSGYFISKMEECPN